ncbi:MAG: D-alanyl-D-alanine carboxypeptidase [Chitinophagaceae bacterium]
MKLRIVISSHQLIILNSALLILFSSCSVEKQIAKSAKADVLDTKALQTAHVGISIFDPAANKYLYNYQGDKYFVPASNTKIPTCFAAMKYLGDSLIAARYFVTGKNIFIEPTADPTFLYPDFPKQPLFEMLRNDADTIMLASTMIFYPLGNGWAWNDYDQYYMAEKSSFPMFGNVIWLSGGLQYPPHWMRNNKIDTLMRWNNNEFWLRPKYFASNLHPDGGVEPKQREKDRNFFYIGQISGTKEIPFVTSERLTELNLLSSVLGKPVRSGYTTIKKGEKILYSQPTDSLLKPMMHRSDNFFAEQSLLMVSNEMLGVMNDEKIIDTLLKTDFKDLPQKPRWADGSGLSRYNLFTPQDFVAILNKMKNEFGMERIKVILPTGGEGTISSYYKADSGYIYAKTGTLSGVVAFSGFLYTKKGKLLIFSTLVNNHQATATEVRRAVEKFLQGIRNNY